MQAASVLLPDPDFPVKAKYGRKEEIVPCIACNECLALAHRQEGMSCTVNPTASREFDLSARDAIAKSSQKIIVVGGGAAGLSAAITAAGRGHEVVLFEKTSEIGGQLKLASRPPGREEIGTLLDYYVRELRRLHVTVRTDRYASIEDVRSEDPDAVVIAAGARPVIPAAFEKLKRVSLGWQVLAGECTIGDSCVVVGGGLVGVEVADYLASLQKRVILVVRSSLLKKAVHADRLHFLRRLSDANIEVIYGAEVKEFVNDTAILDVGGKEKVLKGIDQVIFCMGYEARKEDFAGFLELGVPVHFAGDVQGARKFFQAIEEGTLIALDL